MIVSAFYENIRTGAVHDGLPMTEAVKLLCESGLKGLYVSYESTVHFSGELDEVLRETGIKVTGLHSWIDFSRDKTGYKNLIDQAVSLGTDHVLIVPVCTDQNMETLIEGMKNAVEYGAARGIRVFMEDLDQANSPYNNLAGLKLFLERIPGLLCCFDTGNLIMHQEDEVDGFKQLQNRIRALHLKDRVIRPQNPDDIGKQILDGSCRYPAPVGSGYIRIREILEIAADLPMIVELYDYGPSHMLDGIRSSIEWVQEKALKVNP